jgi:HEAT repeat protein
MHDLTTEPLDALARGLEGEDRERRLAAMEELSRRGREGDLRGVQALVGALDHPSPVTMEAAAEWEYFVESLGRIGPPIVDQLLAILVDQGRSLSVRSGIARALGNIGDHRAYDGLVTILLSEGDDLDLRRYVAFYIGRLRDHRAVQPLLTIAANPDEDRTIRVNALHALGELRDPQSFDVLVSLLHDPEVSNMASTALQSLQDPRAIDQILPTLASDDDIWRSYAASIVGKVGEPAVEPLLALLTSPDWRVRAGAANALGFTGDRRAAGPLTSILLQDSDSRVRREAAGSLGFLENAPVADTLVGALADEHVQVRLAAMQSLYHLALIRRAPTDIFSRVEWVANHDTGTIDGHEVVKDAGQRVVMELRRVLTEEDDRPDFS